MSNLLDKLAEAAQPSRPSPVAEFLKSLSDEHFEAVWGALTGNVITKTKLLEILNSEGGKFGKESFNKFRDAVRAGTITKESVRGSKR